MKVGVSVIARNRPDTLKATVAALVTTLAADTPVVVVDNGSDPVWTREDVGIPLVENWHVIRNAENLGLSRAVNQGLAALYELGCDVLIHLDDDAVVTTQNWTLWLAEIMENNTRLGLAVPNQGWYPEHIANLGVPGYNEIRWGLGFAWALRRDVYDLIGGYDAQLLHQQECDFGLRVRMAGYDVGAVKIDVTHNDPGREPNEMAKAREHIGVVQFVDKWCGYFRGRDWNYGTVPVYRMQQWPPDQEWYRRFSKANNIELNPAPPQYKVEDVRPGERVMQIVEMTTGVPADARRIMIGDAWYFCIVELRNEYAHWARGTGYLDDRDRAIAKWLELTGEKYEGYKWPCNLLRCI